MPLQDRGTEDPDDNAADALALAPLSAKHGETRPAPNGDGMNQFVRIFLSKVQPLKQCVPTRQLFFPLHAILVCSALDASRNRIKETGTGLHLEPPTLMYLQK